MQNIFWESCAEGPKIRKFLTIYNADVDEEIALCQQYFNEYAYNIFSVIHQHQFDLFLDFWPQFLRSQISERNFYICLFNILFFIKDIETQEVPVLPQNFGPEVPGIVLSFGFVSCFPKFEFLGFVLVPHFGAVQE